MQEIITDMERKKMEKMASLKMRRMRKKKTDAVDAINTKTLQESVPIEMPKMPRETMKPCLICLKLTKSHPINDGFVCHGCFTDKPEEVKKLTTPPSPERA